MIEKVTNNDVYSNKFSGRKLKKKEKFDNKHSRTFKPFTLDTIVSSFNADLKMWGVGGVVSRSLTIEVITLRLRIVKLFPTTGYISLKLILNLFLRCRIF